MKKVKVTFECIHGGYGWGEKGNVVSILFSVPPEPDHYYLEHAPGGWEVKKIEVVDV